MSFVTVGRSPHTAHLGSRRSRSMRTSPESVSKCIMRPMSGVPWPRISLIASSACTQPTSPGSTPSTPASAHDGTAPGGGGSGKRQR